MTAIKSTRHCRTFRSAAIWLLAATLLLSPVAAEAAKKKRAAKPQVDRYASIVIEAETGYVLSEKNADKQLYPASLTKIMTIYMTFEAIQQGKLSKNKRIPVSKHAAFQEPSELGLAAGSTIRVEDAIYGLVTKSANDAAVVLAEAIGGSERRFGELMTKRARELGMKNTTFKNASGLHNPAQRSSARDMAILGQAIWRDFPREYRYFSTKSFKYAGRTYANHNKLMNTYIGMDGIKTGYINPSGFNLVASAKRNGTRLIGVVCGGQTSKSRNDHMANLLDTGFDRVNDVRVAGMIAARQQQGTRALSTTTQVATRSAVAQAASGKTTVAVKPADKPAVPRFDAMGLVTEQGDREDNSAALPTPKPLGMPAPATATTQLNVPPQDVQKTASRGMAGGWAVQVGAFTNHSAGMEALKAAHRRLPQSLTLNSEYVIVPLMTNRGVIYRARLTGMNHTQATTACTALGGSCLILAAP